MYIQNIGTDIIYNGRIFSTDACIHYQRFWHVGIHRIIKLQNYVYFYLKCCEVSMKHDCQQIVTDFPLQIFSHEQRRRVAQT